jgi:hypothetical protein
MRLPYCIDKGFIDFRAAGFSPKPYALVSGGPGASQRDAVRMAQRFIAGWKAGMGIQVLEGRLNDSIVPRGLGSSGVLVSQR